MNDAEKIRMGECEGYDERYLYYDLDRFRCVLAFDICMISTVDIFPSIQCKHCFCFYQIFLDS